MWIVCVASPWRAAAQNQPIVTQIDVVGAHKVEEATVRFKLKARVGDPYSPDVVREDIKALYSLGYFEDIEVRADIFEGGLKLTFVLHEKPSIQSIKILGNKKVSADKIKAKMDLVEGAIIPPGALVKNAEKVRLYYEEEGYYQAHVDASEERVSPTEVTVTFSITEGDKFDVGEIRIAGNKHLTEKDIKKHMQTSELYLFFFGGTLKREELQRDLDRIRAYYLDNGFLDIAVADPEIQVDAPRRRLRIIIRVQEGEQYRISELDIKGNTLFPEAQIRSLIKSRAGEVFSRETMQADVVAITDRYAERGYLFADVAPVTDVERAQATVKVSLEITEGQQAFIQRIEIAGNVRTRDKVIRRELALVEGDVFNSRFLQASRQNLESMGYFEDVKIDTRRAQAPDQVDVTVNVKERATGAFTIGGGYSSVDGVMGVASIKQDNLFGLGKRASLSGQIGQYANRFEALYADPHFLDSDYFLQIRLYDFSTDYVSLGYQDWDQSSLGGSVTLGHHLFERVFGSVAYSYERVRIKNVQDTAPEIIKLQAQQGTSYTSAITLALTRNTIDNLGEPTRGLFTSASMEYAGGYLGATNDFYKYNLEGSQYWPLFTQFGRLFVGHLRGWASYAYAYDGTPSLPVQERFFLGGINSLRGFRNFSVSPKDPATGGLVGGTKAGFLQAELLFPLYQPLKMRGVVFFDAGNVLDERNTFSDIFTHRLKRDVGLGIRFTSPLGAIRLEYGINLAPLQGEKRGVLQFTAGTTF